MEGWEGELQTSHGSWVGYWCMDWDWDKLGLRVELGVLQSSHPCQPGVRSQLLHPWGSQGRKGMCECCRAERSSSWESPELGQGCINVC